VNSVPGAPFSIDNQPSSIGRQACLPLSVALEVVLQGIRIRLGRSAVTLAGVALGIAFLMTILTGQQLRRGVSAEAAVRADLSRMASLLAAECGVLRGRDVAVVAAGPLSDLEKRFLDRLARDGVAHLNVADGDRPARDGVTHLKVVDGARLVSEGVSPAAGLRLRPVPPSELTAGVVAVLVMGEGLLERGDWDGGMDRARQSVVAVTRRSQGIPSTEGVRTVSLERQLLPEEQREAEKDRQRERVRTVWITVIALWVTVIGISNAMLMSVTERFREIGTMKCLGALSAFIRRIFMLEAALIGLAGSAVGAVLGFLVSVGAYMGLYGAGLVLSALSPLPALAALIGCVAAGVGLSVIAAIYPARVAARMLPANALRSTI
jgi:hypothetical protein